MVPTNPNKGKYREHFGNVCQISGTWQNKTRLAATIGDKPGGLYDGIRWNSPFTLLDTIKVVDSAGLRLSVLSAWYDIDHVENFGTLAALQQHPGQTETGSCQLPADYLKRFLEEFGEG